MEQRTLDKETESYLRKISHLRSEKRHGRAVQYCDALLPNIQDNLLKNVVLNFKAESLYRIGKKTQQDFLIQDARTIFAQVLSTEPKDFVARQGMERIDRYL